MKMYTAQEMRDAAKDIEADLVFSPPSEIDDVMHRTMAMLRQSADMIERESTLEESSQVGNAAKMREALLLALVFANGMYNTTKSDEYLKLAETIEAAISAPPRNCDIGSAEEQTERFVDFCYRSEKCVSCQMEPKEGTDCILKWAQEPYRKGDEK